MKGFQYEDIINLPYPTQNGLPQISMEERAAQFSPFSALTGLEEAVEETGRYTDHAAELDEDEKTILDAKLRWIEENLSRSPQVELCYFLPDQHKAGGSYVTAMDTVRKIDSYRRMVLLRNGTEIPVDSIRSIEIL